MRGLHFIQYHNAAPIAIGIIFLGAGGAFAATNPDAFFEKTERVVSIDNTYLAAKDLSSYAPQLQILGVTEDAESYYVAYRLSTVDVHDGAWRDVTKDDELVVAKAALGERDLGLYATVQFNQIIDRNIAYLREAQTIERRLVTPKVVAIEYSGLVGRLLDTRIDEFPGYTPVVTPPPPPAPPPISVDEPAPAAEEPEEGVVAGAFTSGPGAPTIQILGNNPARIPIKSVYADLGVVVRDDSGLEFSVKTFVDGKEMNSITIDTEKPHTWMIRYEVTDNAENTASAERIVEVFDPAPPPPSPASTPEIPTATSSEATSTPTE